jgi:hypothetical protein
MEFERLLSSRSDPKTIRSWFRSEIPALGFRRNLRNGYSTHFLQPNPKALAWDFASADQLLSLTVAACGRFRTLAQGQPYWRDGPEEVDFIVAHGRKIWALEVKSGRPMKSSGITAFRKRYPKSKVWLLGENGIALPDFFSRSAAEWFG